MDPYRVAVHTKYNGRNTHSAFARLFLSSDGHLSELRRMIISEQYFIADPGSGRGSVTQEWGTVTIA